MKTKSRKKEEIGKMASKQVVTFHNFSDAITYLNDWVNNLHHKINEIIDYINKNEN